MMYKIFGSYFIVQFITIIGARLVAQSGLYLLAIILLILPIITLSIYWPMNASKVISKTYDFRLYIKIELFSILGLLLASLMLYLHWRYFIVENDHYLYKDFEMARLLSALGIAVNIVVSFISFLIIKYTKK